MISKQLFKKNSGVYDFCFPQCRPAYVSMKSGKARYAAFQYLKLESPMNSRIRDVGGMCLSSEGVRATIS